MDPAGIPSLIESIGNLHGCQATHVETVRVHEKAPNGETVWEGDVEVFAIEHPKTSRAYAWSEATTGTKRRFFAVLGWGPVTGAAEAVRASIMATRTVQN